MNRLIVSDDSALACLHNASLLFAMLDVPHSRLVVPYPFRQSELLGLTNQDWCLLQDSGLELYDLTPEQVADAHRIKVGFPELSANACFSVATTKALGGTILVTEIPQLRQMAEEAGLRVRELLWIIDELHAAEACSGKRLIAALNRWCQDGTVCSSDGTFKRRLQRLRRFSGTSSDEHLEVFRA